MNITVEQLVDAINASKRVVKILVQCDDYYARPGDTANSTITIIDPGMLIEALQELE